MDNGVERPCQPCSVTGCGHLGKVRARSAARLYNASRSGGAFPKEVVTVPSSPSVQAGKIDALMEQASQALVGRKYFDAERLASSALRKAHGSGDFERMARILMPLQEARRHKRDLALESGKRFIVDGELPHGRSLVAGCYLVQPPRVGVDGRLLREAADASEIPVVVVVREPVSRDGLWPIVTVGPVTIRTKVLPPVPIVPKVSKKAKTTKKLSKTPAAPAGPVAPSSEWFVETTEALGDAGIAMVPTTIPNQMQVDAILDRLESHPDHEKLHQRLAELCRLAAREPLRKRRPMDPSLLDDDEVF